MLGGSNFISSFALFNGNNCSICVSCYSLLQDDGMVVIQILTKGTSFWWLIDWLSLPCQPNLAEATWHWWWMVSFCPSGFVCSAWGRPRARSHGFPPRRYLVWDQHISLSRGTQSHHTARRYVSNTPSQKRLNQRSPRKKSLSTARRPLNQTQPTLTQKVSQMSASLHPINVRSPCISNTPTMR